MDGSKLLVDTNIILYALKGDVALAELIHDQDLYISFITRIELLSYPRIDPESIDLIERFLKQVPVIESNPVINADAIVLRRKSGLEVPDAIIAASAQPLYNFAFSVDLTASIKREIETTAIQSRRL